MKECASPVMAKLSQDQSRLSCQANFLVERGKGQKISA